MSAYWIKDEHADDYDDWINELLENAPEWFDGDESAESIVTRYVRWLEERPEVKMREHRAYDSQRTHSSDADGTRFICGWCGGWGHKANRNGMPTDCYECLGLGWYREISGSHHEHHDTIVSQSPVITASTNQAS